MSTVTTYVSAEWLLRNMRWAAEYNQRYTKLARDGYYHAALVTIGGECMQGSMTKEAFGTERIYRKGRYVKTVPVVLKG